MTNLMWTSAHSTVVARLHRKDNGESVITWPEMARILRVREEPDPEWSLAEWDVYLKSRDEFEKRDK